MPPAGWDRGRTLADRFRVHAGERQHLYAHAMRGMANDWEAGGPLRTVCAGYENAPEGAAIQLRLLAAVFRLVLTGRAPELAPFYPCLGGVEPADRAWPVLRTVIGDHVEEVRAGLAVAPQTNEVGRAAALLAGLFDLVGAAGRDRVRLLEVGASAGLNLLVDEFAITGDGWQWGPPDAPVQLVGAVQGPTVPIGVTILERRGCDLSPVDTTTSAGRVLLTSFVWPFDLDRHARLAGALISAERHPVTVDAAGAAAWLPGVLADPPDDVLTVVWHSITQLYWPPTEVAAVEQILAEHGRNHWLATVGLEFAAGSGPKAKPELRTRLWVPGRPFRERRLGTAHDHGPPVRLVQVQ